MSAKRWSESVSREFAYGVTLDLDKGENPETVIAEWTAALKDNIRRQLAPKNGSASATEQKGE